MPLKSLIPKRTSQKSKKAKTASKETSKTVTEVEQMSVLSEVNDVLAELLNNVPEKTTQREEKGDAANSSLPEGDSNSVDEENGNVPSMTSSPANVEVETTTSQEEEISKKLARSVSAVESEIAFHSKSVRRKFGSEGEIISICEKIIPPEQQKELHEAIGKYIDKIIRNSITEAVKNVNVEHLYEDIVKDFSKRNSSQSTESDEDFVVEQRLTSDSVSKLVELSEKNSDVRSGECRDFPHPECDGKISEAESLENENDDVDHVSFGGYLADVDDTASLDDLKSIEEDSLNSSLCSALEHKITTINENEESPEEAIEIESHLRVETSVDVSETATQSMKTVAEDYKSEHETASQCQENIDEEKATICNGNEESPSEERPTEQNIDEKEPVDAVKDTASNEDSETNSPSENKPQLEKDLPDREQFSTTICNGNEESPPEEKPTEQNTDLKESLDAEKDTASNEDSETNSPSENKPESEKDLPNIEQNNNSQDEKTALPENKSEDVALIVMSPEEETLLLKSDLNSDEKKVTPLDADEELLQQDNNEEELKKVNWKVGYLHVKLPHKTRGKAHLKAWKKRRVVIQPDEFVNDPNNPSLVISVYGSDSKKLEASFWHSLSSQKATVFRSSSRTHRYAFTISEDDQAIIHLSAENESATQEWMAAVRAVLWPPSPFMELEKMLSGQEFEISLIDNDFTYHAGLLGMYGYLSITPKKLILLHPQQGYVIQEWYLNTVDKFKFVPQPKAEDAHKVLCMTTCKDSSTGQGDIVFFCNEAVTLLQSLASNIHQVLSYHSKQEGGRYQKELEDIAEWLVAPPQDCLNVECDEHYKVPPRQVKSLLDIPNFIFNKSLSPVASAIYPAPNSEIIEPLDATKTTVSQDSGISTCASSDDFFNCSVTSFVVGGGPLTGKSSDSELSDAYTPPTTPELEKKAKCEVVEEEEQITAAEA